MKEGWEIKKLGEVAVVSSGNSAPQKKELFENGIYPFIRTSDVGQIRKGFISSCVDYLNKDGIKGLKLYLKGTILFPKSGASTFLNHRVMLEIDSFVSSHLATIKGNNSITDDRFLLYFLTTIDARNLMQDIAYPSLKTSDISLISIPLPPLPEQQRIVSIIDKAFEAIDRAIENTQVNLQNAKELFESYLQGVFQDKGDGWEVKTLGDVCEYDKTPYKRDDLPYVGLEDIQSNTGIFVGPFEPRKMKSLTFYFNDEHVLYGRLRPYLNKVLQPHFEGHCSTEIFPIKPKKNLLDRGFLFRWLIATETMKQINNTWTGATLPRANMNAVLEFSINLPSIIDQQAIVKKMEYLSTETKKIESKYQQKLRDLEELKRSVLNKAFAGEL
ncbi:MAG: hypothetical protein RL059_1047 [Bacteroidota bacterium]|jgi:type I restriction enzyme S subunit